MNIFLTFSTVIVSGIIVYFLTQLMTKNKNSIVAITATVTFAFYAMFLFYRPEGWLLIDIIILLVAGIGGAGLGLFISSKPSLITFVIVAGAVDIFSVKGGVTSKLVENYKNGTSDLLNYLVISIPIDNSLKPIVGIGDYFILAAVCFAMIRLGYTKPQLLAAPLSGLLIALIVGLVVGGIYAIPFIALTTVLYATLVKQDN